MPRRLAIDTNQAPTLGDALDVIRADPEIVAFGLVPPAVFFALMLGVSFLPIGGDGAVLLGLLVVTSYCWLLTNTVCSAMVVHTVHVRQNGGNSTPLDAAKAAGSRMGALLFWSFLLWLALALSVVVAGLLAKAKGGKKSSRRRRSSSRGGGGGALQTVTLVTTFVMPGVMASDLSVFDAGSRAMSLAFSEWRNLRFVVLGFTVARMALVGGTVALIVNYGFQNPVMCWSVTLLTGLVWIALGQVLSTYAALLYGHVHPEEPEEAGMAIPLPTK